jgi:recombinational DNA repair ATPase RecF
MATQTRSHVTDQKPSLTLDTLRVEGVRNLESATFRPGPRLNVVFGLNGHGKTTVLEAIYVAATTRSFRTSRLRDLVAHGASTFSIQASFTERRADLPPLTRTQSAVFSEGKLHARLDGQKPPTLADFAVRSPVVVFHPEELALSTGPAALRRRLLDRVALYRAPTFAASLNRYAKALKSRQELLRRGASTHELEAYEQLLATAGAEIVRARRRAHLAIEPAVLEAFARIAAPGLELKLDYRTSGEDDEQVCARELAARRDRDRRAITAGFGQHHRRSRASRPSASAPACTSATCTTAPGSAPPGVGGASTTRRRAPRGRVHEIRVTIHFDGSVTVEDDGRGIPVGMHARGRQRRRGRDDGPPRGGKFDNASYKVSAGLHGVGVSAVNAVSEWLRVEIKREGRIWGKSIARACPSRRSSPIGVTDKHRHHHHVQARHLDLHGHRVQLRDFRRAACASSPSSTRGSSSTSPTRARAPKRPSATSTAAASPSSSRCSTRPKSRCTKT